MSGPVRGTPATQRLVACASGASHTVQLLPRRRDAQRQQFGILQLGGVHPPLEHLLCLLRVPKAVLLGSGVWVQVIRFGHSVVE